MSVLSAPILIVGIFIAALYVFQNKLLYHPHKVNPDNYAPPGMGLWFAESYQENPASRNILGLLAEPAEESPAKGTAVVFHGNAGHAGHRSFYSQQLTDLGIRVILAEYPGYGPRSGKPEEAVLIDDAVNIVTLAHQRYGQPIWLLGESLGAGVVAAVAARTPSLIQGVVLITPWNRLSDVASYHYPFLPVRWLLTSEYDSVKALAGFEGPKFVILADSDTIVPANLGLDLYRNLAEPKRLITVEGAGHNDWPMHADPSIWADVMQWIQQKQVSR